MLLWSTITKDNFDMYIDSVAKNIAQLAVVADSPIIYNNKVLTPPNTLAISPAFWRSYKCKSGCGGCCREFTIDWLPDEWECARIEYPFLEQLVTSREVVVNNIPYEIFSALPDKQIKRCQFFNLVEGNCNIHSARPYSCRIEIIKFRKVGNRGYVMKAPFGRAWQMKRLIDGGPILCEICPFSLDQLVNNDIPVIRQLENWANYLGITTYLSEIIEVLNIAIKVRYTDKVIVADSTDNGRISLW